MKCFVKKFQIQGNGSEFRKGWYAEMGFGGFIPENKGVILSYSMQNQWSRLQTILESHQNYNRCMFEVSGTSRIQWTEWKLTIVLSFDIHHAFTPPIKFPKKVTVSVSIGYNATDTSFGWNGYNDGFTVYYPHFTHIVEGQQKSFRRWSDSANAS